MTNPGINQPGTSNTIAVHVVLRKRRSRWYLYDIKGPRNISGEALMAKIHAIYVEETGTICSFHGKGLGIRRPVINIGTLSASISDANVLSHPHEVTITSSTRSRELTAGFYRPRLLRTCRPFVTAPANYEHVLVGSPWRKAIVVDFEMNGSFVVVMFGITLIMTIGVGVALGVATKRAELGIAASAGLFAMVSVIEVLLFWLDK
ncbi:hypothetical protein K458DRAFT_393369 [Lentithecium fluviatile CBS 122367]|uniref:Uncharacterized protein n=1 Tax=Lentithecium fluviatile CBS 122367 TaxID=1168545 RepID=A0A6G1IPC9_9PLEO|nr:hypothetical protein K458DRAFT_393369 [Lentithecium fluviatile CBS 122367]